MKTSHKAILSVVTVILGALLSAATVGPVPQWTAYTLGFTTNSTASQARTYLGVTNTTVASTNIAQLNGTNTFTGTNTVSWLNINSTNLYSFGQPVILGQTVLVTNGVGLITNVAFTNNVMATTVSNGFQYTSPVFDARLPAVPPNYRVTFSWWHEVTNANAGSMNFHCYVGEKTNYMSGTTGPGSAGTLGSSGYYILTTGAMIPFITWGSSTNQFAQGPYPFRADGNPGNQVDCSTNGWRCMIGVVTQGTTGTYTNYNSIKFIVNYAPLF